MNRRTRSKPTSGPMRRAALLARPRARQKTDSAARPSVNPVRRWTLIVFAGCAVLLIYHLIADFLTPYTSQAYVQAFVVDIAPEVAGAVVEVNVVDNVEVQAGQTLFRIDRLRFQIVVEAAEAKLTQACQELRTRSIMAALPTLEKADDDNG